MSYSPEFSYSDYEDDEEEDDKMEIPTIKLKLKLNPYTDQDNKTKKRKKKHKKQTHPPVGGKRPFALLQQKQRNEDQVDSDFEMKKPKFNQQQLKSNKVKKGLLPNGEKPKKRGRPTNKAKAAALAAAMPKVQDTLKKDAKSLFIKLLDNIQKKDEYGFFLEPVNPEYVPDYLKIIKSPMDFSTMRTKIEKKVYRGISDFRYDFELIVNNAKLYNAKDTIYYKSADKVHESGLKLMDRYEKQIEEEIHKQVESREASVDIRSSTTTTPYKKKKKKVAETGVLYGPDGSLFTVGGVHDIESLIPMDPPFCEAPQMTVTNAAALPSTYYANREEYHYYKHFTHSAHFSDYGPFTTLGGQPPGAFYSTVDAAFIYPMFGDDRGEAYIKSLWDFMDGDKDELYDYIEQKSIYLTRGAWSVMEETLKRRNESLLK